MKNRAYANRRAALIRKQEQVAVQNHSRTKVAIDPSIPKMVVLAILSSVILMASWTMARATEVQRVVGASGIEAWLVEDHTVPIIAMDFSFTGGTTQDTEGKDGAVNMLTSLYDEGAGDMDNQAFQTALEENAIKLSFDAGRDRFYGSLRTLTPNKKLAFELLAKALTSPRFDADPIERMRAQWIAGAKRQETNPDSITSKAFREAAYPNHPYSRNGRGTTQTLAAITRDDLVKMHNAIITRDGLTIGVVGAIDAESLKVILDEVFGALPAKGELKAIEQLTSIKPGKVHVALDVPQTSIRFGSIGIDRHDEDFFAAYLVNHILGGGSFTSRLYNEIREKRGLVYGVYSYLANMDHIALFGGGMATRTDNSEQALMLATQEIARMGNDGPTQEELDAAKKFLIGSYPLRFDSSSKISRQLVGIQNDNLGIDYFDKRNSYIENVTLEEAKRAAARLLDPSKLLIITVGKQMKNAALEK